MRIRTCYLESYKLFLFQVFLKIQSKSGALSQPIFHNLHFDIRLTIHTYISLHCRFMRRTGIRQFGSEQYIVRVQVAITYASTIRIVASRSYIIPFFITGNNGCIFKIISNRFLCISFITLISSTSPKREFGFRMI